MRRALCIWLVIAACRGAAPRPQPHSERVAGTVLDAAGQPVAGARVAMVPLGLFDPTGARYPQVTTRRDGRFSLPAPTTPHVITVTAAGLGAAVAPISDAIHLRLGPSAAARRVSGRVVTHEGRPRARAEVRIARDLGERGEVFLVETTVDGTWTAWVPPGDYHVNAVHAASNTAAAQRAATRDPVDLVLEPVAPVIEPAVIDWLRTRAVTADLAPLRDLVGDARVVGLGEATHGTREIFQAKHRLVEYLVGELGFTIFAIEIGLADAFAIDDYVQGGPGDLDLLLAAQGVAIWQTEELRDVIRWLRTYNATHPRKVHVHGLDIRSGGRAARAALDHLARFDPAARASAPAHALEPLADPFLYTDVVRQPAPRLRALAADARTLLAGVGDQPPTIAGWRCAMHLRALAATLEWLAADGIAERVRVRESAMAEHVLQALTHRGPRSRAVVWAHNAHVAGDPDATPRMMGVELRARLGSAYRAFGSVLERGAYQSIDHATRLLRDYTIAPAAPGSLEHALAATGHRLAVFDLRAPPPMVARWLRAFQPLRQFDGLYDDVRPSAWSGPYVNAARDYDALVFVASGGVARMLPPARAAFTAPPPPPSPAPPVHLGLDDARAISAGTAGWRWSAARAATCGYTVALDTTDRFAGAASARVARSAGPGVCTVPLGQLVDATPYRGRRLQLRAAIRVERPAEHAHLFLQSDGHRASITVTATTWSTHGVELDVAADARTLEIGFVFDGEGRAWLDDVSVEPL